MRELLISINEKYQRNKKIIWFIVAVVVIFLLVTRNMDKISEKSRGSSNVTTTSESIYNNTTQQNTIKDIASSSEDNYNTIKEQIENTSMNSTKYISLFIELCINKKYESAYEMLSEDCKNIMYPSKEQFINKYINTKHASKKNYNITLASGRTYKISYRPDAITTGGSTAVSGEEYITILENGKLNINDLVSVNTVSYKGSNSCISAEITQKITYYNYVIYQVKIKNIVKADIYLNNTMNNGLYLVDSNKNKINIKMDDYSKEDYFVQSESTKLISLKFLNNFGSANKITSMNFENIQVVNKNYYDNDTHSLQTTIYPEKINLKINM